MSPAAAPPLPLLPLLLVWLSLSWRLRRVGFAAALAELPRALPASSRVPDTAAASTLARRFHRLARRVPGSACLDQALALSCHLRRLGADAHLVIAATRQAGFAAHAWVEIAAQPLDEPDLDSAGYKALSRWPEA